MRTLGLLAPAGAALLLLTPSCTTYRSRTIVGQPSYELARFERPGGGVESYRLDVSSSSGDATLEILSEYELERASLGLELSELDKQAAEKRGLRPYTGLLVRGVQEASAAEAAGIRSGDVVIALDGKETIYENQVAELEERLAEGQVVQARILRPAEGEITVPLETRTRIDHVREPVRVPLHAPPRNETVYAGVGLRGIPGEWSERIYGQGRNAVVISTVEIGSPAWLSGLRAGDVIEAVDGQPVPQVDALSRMIARYGAEGRDLPVTVNRGSGERFDTTVRLRDYAGTTEVHVPLVFKTEDGVQSDRFSLGPFGLILSSRSSYVDSATRETREESSFSMLLGLFKHSSGPGYSRTRLLWFITIDG